MKNAPGRRPRFALTMIDVLAILTTSTSGLAPWPPSPHNRTVHTVAAEAADQHGDDHDGKQDASGRPGKFEPTRGGMMWPSQRPRGDLPLSPVRISTYAMCASGIAYRGNSRASTQGVVEYERIDTKCASGDSVGGWWNWEVMTVAR